MFAEEADVEVEDGDLMPGVGGSPGQEGRAEEGAGGVLQEGRDDQQRGGESYLFGWGTGGRQRAGDCGQDLRRVQPGHRVLPPQVQ